MSSEENQPQEQAHEGENGTSNNADVPEIELIIKVTRYPRKNPFPEHIYCLGVCPRPLRWSAHLYFQQTQWKTQTGIIVAVFRES